MSKTSNYSVTPTGKVEESKEWVGKAKQWRSLWSKNWRDWGSEPRRVSLERTFEAEGTASVKSLGKQHVWLVQQEAGQGDGRRGWWKCGQEARDCVDHGKPWKLSAFTLSAVESHTKERWGRVKGCIFAFAWATGKMKWLFTEKGQAMEEAGLGIGVGCPCRYQFWWDTLRLRCPLDTQMDTAKRQLGMWICGSGERSKLET